MNQIIWRSVWDDHPEYDYDKIHIAENSIISPGVIIHPGTVIYPNVIIESGVTIGPNCTIGFQPFKKEQGGQIKHIDCDGTVIIRSGSYLHSGVNIDCGITSTIIGHNTHIDSHVHIAHDCAIGDNVLIAAGTIFGGWVTIGDNTFIGLNTTIKNRITIGHNCKIGMGSIIIKNIPDDFGSVLATTQTLSRELMK